MYANEQHISGIMQITCGVMHDVWISVGATDRWCKLRGLGRPVGEGSNRGPAVAHRDGGAACLRPWPRGPELPAVGIVHGVGIRALLAVSPC